MKGLCISFFNNERLIRFRPDSLRRTQRRVVCSPHGHVNAYRWVAVIWKSSWHFKPRQLSLFWWGRRWWVERPCMDKWNAAPSDKSWCQVCSADASRDKPRPAESRTGRRLPHSGHFGHIGNDGRFRERVREDGHHRLWIHPAPPPFGKRGKSVGQISSQLRVVRW